MIECKFHHSAGVICDVKVPLYIQARFKDIEQQHQKQNGNENKFHQGWVVTNTRFSVDALQYGTCAGLNLLGWDYPKGNSLKEQIDDSRLYPVTCLHTITLFEKQKLPERQIVLCKELNQNEHILLDIGISQNRISGIMNEVKDLVEDPIVIKNTA